MADPQTRIDELAALMDEFRLGEARWEGDGFAVGFRRRAATPVTTMVTAPHGVEAPAEPEAFEEEAPEPAAAAAGLPVSSPMSGIFYRSSSPSAPPFVKVGDVVSAGQIVGLIEAMKVFNEIPANVAGTVLEVLVESGQVVQPGDVLLRIG